MLIKPKKENRFNLGRVEGVDYKCERYDVNNEGVKEYWYLLADSDMTYLCSNGPFNTPEARDIAIIKEVEKRNEKTWIH